MAEHTSRASHRYNSARLFIIGPAGVGKTTCGQLLARELGFKFVDLDTEFIRQIGEIQSWIDHYGYLAYCRRNTKLFHDLIFDTVTQAVYAISSGFLIYDELDRSLASNAKALNSFGISILLLPSESLSESADIVVARLLQRRPWLNPQKERQKFEYRYRRYRAHGDIRIFSKEGPDAVAAHMETRYLEYLRTRDALDSVDSEATIVSHDEDDID
jgi:shikimate kinase